MATKSENYDFSGWATKNDLRCSDGLIIRRNAFRVNDGEEVPLVWNHQHNDPNNILGHALLENRDEGVYAYCRFNDTESGRTAKELVKHGDVSALSIFANRLKKDGQNVMHGIIREVSLVIAGANPGAFIDSVIKHGEKMDDEAVIFTGEEIVVPESDKEEKMEHADNSAEKENNMATDNRTVKDVFDTLNEDQKKVVYALIGQALEGGYDTNDDDEEDDEDMKHNIFDQDQDYEDALMHAEFDSIVKDAKRYGSMKDAFLAHGIEQIDYLFPEPTNLNTPPEFIKRDTGWVSSVMNSVHKTPFSRIKSMFADITGDEARARGYIKGKYKKEEVFSLLKRTTTPTTIYKKQKMDRDDVIDITDFDVIAWLKSEMRMMLDEEIARAILIGDGRLSSSDDKINEQNVRPIWKDEDLYTIKSIVNVKNTDPLEKKAAELIDQTVRAMDEYEGSGDPTMYMAKNLLSACLLLKDSMGHRLYKNKSELANAMGVSDIVTVPQMNGLKREDGSVTYHLMALVVNMKDYNLGADKGGQVNMFDDFDIDYNQQKYLIETRCSGALVKPYSAIALEIKTTGMG